MPVSQTYQGIAVTVFSGLKGERPAPKAGALPTALHPVIEFSIRLVVFSQTRRDTNFAIPGYFFSIPQLRGDASRHTEGSGLGLSIARSLVQLQGGRFDLAIDADLFRADITFPLSESAAS